MIRCVLSAFYSCKIALSYPSTPTQVKRQRTLKKNGYYLDLVDVMLFSWMKNKVHGGSHLMCQSSGFQFSVYVDLFRVQTYRHYPGIQYLQNGRNCFALDYFLPLQEKSLYIHVIVRYCEKCALFIFVLDVPFFDLLRAF